MRQTEKIIALYDGKCRFCKQTIGILRGLDWLHQLRFVDLHDSKVRSEFAPDIPFERLHSVMHVRLSNGKYEVGFYAFRTFCWHLPLLWILAPFLYLPGAAFIGVKVYDWIASSRSCQSGECATC